MSGPQRRDDADRFHDYGIHIPTRTIVISNAIDEVEAERVLKNIHILESINKEPITIIINTPGGYVFQGMAIYGAIAACESYVTAIVRGQASSMGSLILQAADHRVVDPYAIIMIHHGSDGYDPICTQEA